MKLGDILISHGAIDQEKLEAALSDQRAFGGRLGRTLVDLGYLTEEKLVAALAEQLGLTTIELDTVNPDPDVLQCLAVDACERYGVFPVRLDRKKGVLWLATAEPERNNLQEVAQLAQLTLEPMLAPMSAIDRAIRTHYYGERGRAKQRLGDPISGIPQDVGHVAPAPMLAVGPAVPAPPVGTISSPGARPVGRSTQGGLPSNVSNPPAPAAPGNAESPQLPLTLIAPAGPRPADATAELRELLVRLERAVSAQGRAFRSLVELLQEKGVVRRGELGARTSKKSGM
jgi:type IV pilus assembly protein PilB